MTTLRQRRESTDEKAARLLTSGKLTVVRKYEHDYIAAECEGDSGKRYDLGWNGERWHCSCKAHTDCSHLRALWLVTVKLP